MQSRAGISVRQAGAPGSMPAVLVWQSSGSHGERAARGSAGVNGESAARVGVSGATAPLFTSQRGCRFGAGHGHRMYAHRRKSNQERDGCGGEEQPGLEVDVIGKTL